MKYVVQVAITVDRTLQKKVVKKLIMERLLGIGEPEVGVNVEKVTVRSVDAD